MSKKIEQTNTVIISGANGFIGKHLVATLEKRGFYVIPVPRQMLLQFDQLQIFMRQHRPDYIFHLGAYGNHGMQKDVMQTVLFNYMGTFNMLQASKDIDYKAFINFGSSSEYGHKEEPMHEALRLDPDTFYAATKAGATHLARAFAKQYKKPIVTVRPFSVYGPGEAEWRFIPTICNALLTNKRIPVVRYPQHDWIYINDFIKGVLLAMMHPETEVINIGTGSATSNDEVLKTLSFIAKREVRTKENAYEEQPHHSRKWVAFNGRLRALGWHPNYPLAKGLALTYISYKKLYDKKQSPQTAHTGNQSQV